jgi:UPF0271 protein
MTAPGSGSERGARRIDLNADLGEGITDDAGLLEVVTSANVACGFHAGDDVVMQEVCEAAAVRGVVVGAQVSYLDREGFGRRPMDLATDLLVEWVVEQVEALRAAAAGAGLEVAYVKPHGALYNRVVDDEAQAAAVLEGSGSLPVLGLPGSVFLELARQAGRTVIPEGFPDRGYTTDGRLVPRDQTGALVHDVEQVAGNAITLAEAGAVRTVCVHGDSPHAVRAAQAVRRSLEDAGWLVQAWHGAP